MANYSLLIDWAQWRTVVNAVIHPIVLTYTAPVWYAGQTAVLCELHTAQNAATRHIAGAFPTISVEPSLAMGTMPIDLRLDMLIKNASLRPYRLLLNS